MLKETAYGVSSSSSSRPGSLTESSTTFATSSLFPAGTVFEGHRKLTEPERRSKALPTSVPYASSPPEATRMSKALASQHGGADGHAAGSRAAAALDFTLSNSTNAASALVEGAMSQNIGGKGIPALGTLSLSARVYLRLCLGEAPRLLSFASCHRTRVTLARLSPPGQVENRLWEGRWSCDLVLYVVSRASGSAHGDGSMLRACAS